MDCEHDLYTVSRREDVRTFQEALVHHLTGVPFSKDVHSFEGYFCQHLVYRMCNTAPLAWTATCAFIETQIATYRQDCEAVPYLYSDKSCRTELAMITGRSLQIACIRLVLWLPLDWVSELRTHLHPEGSVATEFEKVKLRTHAIARLLTYYYWLRLSFRPAALLTFSLPNDDEEYRCQPQDSLCRRMAI